MAKEENVLKLLKNMDTDKAPGPISKICQRWSRYSSKINHSNMKSFYKVFYIPH